MSNVEQMSIFTEVKTITIKCSPKSLAEWGPEWSSFFQMVTKCQATLQTIFSYQDTPNWLYTSSLGSLFHIPYLCEASVSPPAPSPSCISVTGLANLVTVHGIQ